jgi:hypothetical protein
VKVFVDEDTGASLGRALREVGVDAWVVGRSYLIRPGEKDHVWIPIVAGENRLILSRNSQMLEPQYERQILIDNKAGLVLLPQHVSALTLLRLVLSKWDWLTLVWEAEARPFAFRIAQSGRITRESLTAYKPRRRPRDPTAIKRPRRSRSPRGRSIQMPLPDPS